MPQLRLNLLCPTSKLKEQKTRLKCCRQHGCTTNNCYSNFHAVSTKKATFNPLPEETFTWSQQCTNTHQLIISNINPGLYHNSFKKWNAKSVDLENRLRWHCIDYQSRCSLWSLIHAEHFWFWKNKVEGKKVYSSFIWSDRQKSLNLNSALFTMRFILNRRNPFFTTCQNHHFRRNSITKANY